MTRFAAIVLAAGAGERLGAGVPKALVAVAGTPLVTHAVARVAAAGADPIIVVAPPDALVDVTGALPDVAVEVTVVAGGAQRADSVRAGLAHVPDGIGLVAVHDAARGLAPADLVARTVEAVAGDVVAAAPALPVADTLKRVDGDTVVATVDRSPLVAVQTPQVFRVDVLRAAHEGDPDATDDLVLVERAIADDRVTGRVVVVAGQALAMKVTRPDDLVVASALLEGAS